MSRPFLKINGLGNDFVVIDGVRQVIALTPEQVNAAARTLDANTLTWVVVGDLSKIEAGIRALDIGPVQVIDADGKPVAPAK